MFSKFLKNCQASVAPILALTAIPLIGTVGMAVDYTRASAARAAFQSALDSTALMLSKTAAMQSSGDLSAAATATFNALYTRPDTHNVAITADYSAIAGSTVKVSGTGTIYAYTIMYHAGDKRFAAAIPYASIIVELDDAPGALLAANLLEAPYTEAKVGRRVEVVFERLNDDITLPQFRLARDAR